MIQRKMLILSFGLAACGLAVEGQTAAEANRLASDGKIAEAIEVFEELVRRTPDHGETWYGFGRLLHDQRMYERAEEAFENAAELGFQTGGAFLRLGMIAIETGDPQRGLEEIRKAAAAGLPVGRMLQQFPVWSLIEEDETMLAKVAALHPCATAEHRQFDFWIGEWDVYSPQGQQLGTNRIEKILDGCVLLESWQGTSAGKSFNRFDSAQQRWIQRWVDDSGTALDMRGSLEDGRMVLHVGHEEGQLTQRWIWTSLSGGRVRQMAEQQNDETGEWSVVWDSIYVPRGEEFSAGGL